MSNVESVVNKTQASSTVIEPEKANHLFDITCSIVNQAKKMGASSVEVAAGLNSGSSIIALP